MYNELRIAWLRVENAFNGPFGQALNPWYHLGAIAFFLFWVVVISGAYLYIFYRTGVQQAYDSVEIHPCPEILRRRGAKHAPVRLRWHGGNHALLHMVRNFATGRFRNFRWFSWVSGVLLIWLVYACGINGYWLVWDKLAQFIAVATTEWFSWLPLFSEPLARNFLLQGDVSDRFFTLLSFAHITLPLVLLLIMWIHTKRINSAGNVPATTSCRRHCPDAHCALSVQTGRPVKVMQISRFPSTRFSLIGSFWRHTRFCMPGLRERFGCWSPWSPPYSCQCRGSSGAPRSCPSKCTLTIAMAADAVLTTVPTRPS